MDSTIKSLTEMLPQGLIRMNEPMSNHTSFRAGGQAYMFALPQNESQFLSLIRLCMDQQFPYFVMGNGTNLLVKDTGYDGLIIKTTGLQHCILGEDGLSFIASPGIILSRLANTAWENSLSGLEFASGIPGTLGGALSMNAGAYGGEMKDVTQWVKILNQDGGIETVQAENLGFAYRNSRILAEQLIVLAAGLKLIPGSQEDIRRTMDDLNGRRKDKQPLDMPSCGSTFKRPQGHFAGKLIMDAGLSGYTIGGAMVSPKHCGFIVNTGKATATDILQLMDHVRRRVADKFQVLLEPEVKILG